MTKSPVNVSITIETTGPIAGHTTAEADTLETLESDQLTRASGGFYQGSCGGNGGGYGGYNPYGGYGWGYPQPQFYTVKKGDNLTHIARGANQSLQQLLQWNPQYQQNPNLIHPGERVLTGVNYGYPRYY